MKLACSVVLAIATADHVRMYHGLTRVTAMLAHACSTSLIAEGVHQRPIAKSQLHAGMIARERLVSALSQKLMEAQAAHCWLGLWGKPGLGKSLLASALRAELQHEFPGRTCLLELPHLESTAPLVLGQDIIQDALRQLGAAKRADIQQVRLRKHLLLRWYLL